VSHGVVIALELAGAVLILAGFTLAQLRLLDQHSLVYLVLNLVGSFVLAVIALVDRVGGQPGRCPPPPPRPGRLG
jgi:hypothetical protein